jgi:hypothetical protein
MKTFQNHVEGFVVAEAPGGKVSLDDVADQSAELFNRCHMRRDVKDDEILNLFCLKEIVRVATEREQRPHNRIRGFSVDDEILLGDEEISNFFCTPVSIAGKRVHGGF